MRTKEEINADLREYSVVLAEAKEKQDRLQAELKGVKREEQRKANEEAGRRADELRARLERDNGVVGNPKADLLWSKAWELGHANGLSEVECYYDDLVELIK